jgi:predicted  nucleic acid-binding Zn-ribbon protein
MPHQCVKCGTIYPDGSSELLKGCNKCTGRFFFFVRKEQLDRAKEITANLTSEEKDQMESDVLDIVGAPKGDNKPVVLHLESIRVVKPGKYELDLVDLFKGRPLVYKLEEGKYIIDIASTFEAEDLDLDEPE